MSIVADPDVATNRRFYTCSGSTAPAGPRHPRVSPGSSSTNYSRATQGRAPCSPASRSTSGRHGGCRLRFDPRGELYVGTGDAAVGTNPQNLHSLNGKVLRLNRFTGKPSPRNPWTHAANSKKRYIYNYGHRNVQGLAWRGADDRMWSVEHGTDRDDEVNRSSRAATTAGTRSRATTSLRR